MNNQVKQDQQDCKECYQIKCRYCGWKPDEFELQKVLNREIRVCPDCRKAP